MNCIICGELILSGNKNRIKCKKKECLKLYLKNYYINNPERCGKASLKYRKKHIRDYKEYQKNYQKNYYYRNKNKWVSRSLTYDYLKKGYITITKICKNCKSLENIQLHHQIYPTNANDLIKAVKDNLIYYLCGNCHHPIRRKYPRTEN